MACVRRRRNRYVIDLYDQTGRRRWETLPEGTTRKEANEILGDIERKVRQGNYIPAKKLPLFSEVADSWHSSKDPNIRNSTSSQYKGHIENHLKPFFGNSRIRAITFDQIEKFKAQSVSQGLTAPTLRKILVTLGQILTFAVRMRYLDFNPAREIEKPRGKSLHGDNEEMNVLQRDEILALFHASATDKDRVFFMTAIFTGMRMGELLGLKWEDFNWVNSQVHVRRTWNHGEFYEPKSATSRRKIDLPQVLIGELKKWKLACPPGELDLVFPTHMGTPDDANNVRDRRFYPALRRAGLHKIRPHDMRHTYASLLIAQGEHPKYIQVQMGQSSINVTMDTYGHLMDTVNRAAADRLGEQIFNGGRMGNGSKMVAETKKGSRQKPENP